MQRWLAIILVGLSLTACGAGGGAKQAQKIVQGFLQAGREGNIEAAYALVINVPFGGAQERTGTEFVQKIAGPDAKNMNKLGETMKANYEKVRRQVKGVERNNGSQAEQYWVTVEETGADNKVGEIRYLLVQTDGGWRMDMAQSDFRQAIVAQ